METILSWANAGLAIVVVIGLLLFFHEAGHFLAAKACRMAVYQFAMGFGPALWQRKWGDTVYAIRAIPFGGFVHIAGMEPAERDVERGFYTRPRWQGAIVVCAGTFMNVVLAVLVYWVVNVFSGVAVPENRDVIIRSVFAGDPAAAGGIQPGDRIVGVGHSRFCAEVRTVAKGSLGEKMGLTPGSRVFQIGERSIATPADFLRVLKGGVRKDEKIWAINGDAKGIDDALVALKAPPASALREVPAEFQDRGATALARRVLGVTFEGLDQFTVHRYISTSPGKTVHITVLRGSETVPLTVTPAPDHDRLEMVDSEGKLVAPHVVVGRIGVTLGPALRRAGLVEGLGLALVQSAESVATVVLTIKAMILGKIAAEPTGPIGIMAMTAETAKLGWASVLALCGLISANLAVINMVPIPPLDGFHLALLGVERVMRRRVDQRTEMMVRFAGLFIILGLFLFLSSKDIMNLIRYGTY